MKSSIEWTAIIKENMQSTRIPKFLKYIADLKEIEHSNMWAIDLEIAIERLRQEELECD